MKVDAHDWSSVAAVADTGVDTCFGTSAVVAVTGVESSFLCADKEGGRISGRERHAGGREVFCFTRGWGGEFEVFLGLRQHVNGPATDDAVSGAGDDIICVLGTDNLDTVDWVGVAARGGACKGSFLDGEGRTRSGVPKKNLATVGTTED